jgi:hypothetical protein
MVTWSTTANETGCRNAGTSRTQALTLSASARGQEKRQQVIPALTATGPTLPAILRDSANFKLTAINKQKNKFRQAYGQNNKITFRRICCPRGT